MPYRWSIFSGNLKTDSYFHVMKFTIPILFIVAIFSCKPATESTPESIDTLAAEYIQLALTIGQYDESFVDAYYGPDSLKIAAKPNPVFPKDSLLNAVKELRENLKAYSAEADSALANRAAWIDDQLIAFDRRIRIFTEEYGTFDQESKDLFGVVAPNYDEEYFKKIILDLESILPGEGSVQERFQTLANRFIIPKDKLDTVFNLAIAECRMVTSKYYQLPQNEDFQLEFVTNKSWNGYNWYKGNYQSLIQINTDLNIFVDHAIDVGSHESYPGHHVYNMLLEKNLYRDKGLLEVSMYPLFSPQSLIAEGSANYGIEMVFPGADSKIRFSKYVLLPAAGLDTTGITLYFRALEAKGKLNYVRNEVGRKMLSGEMNETEALRWLEEFGLYNKETATKSIAFIKGNRSYVINYNYGLDLVRAWMDKRMNGSDDPALRWKIFGELLSNQIRIKDLQ